MKILVACELRPFEPVDELASEVAKSLNAAEHSVELLEMPTAIYRGGDIASAALIARSYVLPDTYPLVSVDLAGHLLSAKCHIAVVRDADVERWLGAVNNSNQDARNVFVESLRQCSHVLCESESARSLLAGHGVKAQVVDFENLADALGGAL